MSDQSQIKWHSDKVAHLLSLAGGRVVGRTRLQKLACLLEMAGEGVGFKFSYHHYGPYSEELAIGAKIAALLNQITETEKVNSWGGTYSVYELSSKEDAMPLAKRAVDADLIELELAVTAAFLRQQGEADPWGELVLRKPEKATSTRLQNAKRLYSELQQLDDQGRLPQL